MINALTIPPSPPPKKCDTVFSRAMMTIGRCFIIWFFFEMFFLNEGDIFYGYSNFQNIGDFFFYGCALYYHSFLWPIYTLAVNSDLFVPDA